MTTPARFTEAEIADMPEFVKDAVVRATQERLARDFPGIVLRTRVQVTEAQAPRLMQVRGTSRVMRVG